MTMVVHLPEELARQVAAVSVARQQTPKQVTLDAIATAVHPSTDQAPTPDQLA